MRVLLNTLYVTQPTAYLSKDGMSLVISKDQKEIFRIPIINIESVVTFGYMGASPGLMKLCVDNNVSLSFLTPNGRFIAHIVGPTRGNVILSVLQYDKSRDEKFALDVSKIIIAGKIHNSRSILQRFQRDYKDVLGDIDAKIKQLNAAKNQILKCDDLDELRGIEGRYANLYFSSFPDLILHQKDYFIFKNRSKHPPKDEVNIMLSFIYTLLTNDVTAALETVGLDPYVGFMHAIRPGRASLALDMVEEFRAYLGDRLVLSLINRKQIAPKDFERKGDDICVMTDEGKKRIISAWQERKKDEIIHPFLNEKVYIGLLPYIQAKLMARFLRGELDSYPVFLLK